MLKTKIYLILSSLGLACCLSPISLLAAPENIPTPFSARQQTSSIPFQILETAPPSSATPKLTAKETPELQSFQQYMLTQFPEIKTAKNDWERAVILRNILYQHIRFDSPTTPFTFPVTLEALKAALSGQNAHMCQGIGLFYIALLEAFGINARTVYLANTAHYKGEFVSTHFTVEVFLNNKWVLQDPTFNIHWELNQVPLSTIELANAFTNHENPIASSDGYPLLPNRHVENYFTPYSDFVKHIEISYFSVFNPNAGQDEPFLSYPDPIPWRYYVYSLPLKPLTQNSASIDWDFSKDALDSWALAKPNQIQIFKTTTPQSGVILLTDHTKFNNQFLSPHHTLAAGHYHLQIEGKVVKGGMCAGVLTVAPNEYLASGCYIFPQFSEKTATQGISLPFDIKTKNTAVIVILGNFSFTPHSSEWFLKDIRIVTG